MINSFYVAVDGRWLAETPGHEKKLSEKHLVPVGGSVMHLADDCEVAVKFRDDSGQLQVDPYGKIVRIGSQWCLKSEELSSRLSRWTAARGPFVLFFEGSARDARCVVYWEGRRLLEELSADETLRLDAYGLPPVSTTTFAQENAERIYKTASQYLSKWDEELFGVQASAFLGAPHILVPLFAHVMRLSSEAHVNFPFRLKKIAEHLRTQLQNPRSHRARIETVKRDHQALWLEVRNQKVAFLDGGASRIAGIPGTEPDALRVGVFAVRPGVADPSAREDWLLRPFVVHDIVEPVPDAGETTGPADPRRLQEAARYVLEPLTAIEYLGTGPSARAIFLHGPLVNQFSQYDETFPNYIPCLSPAFLERHGITQVDVQADIRGIPRTVGGNSLWNHFMSVYGYVMRRVFEHTVPMIGVVERTAGRWLADGLLRSLLEDGLMTEKLRAEISRMLEEYDIGDDFLFGCILREGEYITPIEVPKNPPHRSRDNWRTVVEQYPRPFATVLKTTQANFPFRLELNRTAAADAEFILRLLYHTSRLLPRYAFPVGLDIVDKYAKVPDWLSRGVSSRIAADVLQKALQLGDAELVGQIRQFLARTPRDFFFRPQAH